MPSFRRRVVKHRRRRKKMPIVKLIKRVIKNESEHKYHTVQDTEPSITDSSPWLVDISNIGNGTDENTRIGNNVDFSKVRLRFALRSSTNSNTMMVRVYIIQSTTDADPNNLPNTNGLFPPLRTSLVRYKVLFDKTYQYGLGINQSIIRDVNVKRGLLPGKWATSSGDSHTMGRILFHVQTDNNNANDLNATLDSRLYFIDN